MTLYDQQTGKLVTGTPTEITQFYFTMVDDQGNKIGVFDISHLKNKNTDNGQEGIH
jgi:hypothetical protein